MANTWTRVKGVELARRISTASAPGSTAATCKGARRGRSSARLSERVKPSRSSPWVTATANLARLGLEVEGVVARGQVPQFEEAALDGEGLVPVLDELAAPHLEQRGLLERVGALEHDRHAQRLAGAAVQLRPGRRRPRAA